MAQKRGFTASPYHLMSAAEKRATTALNMRESAVTCPQCDVQVMPVDLLAHIAQRCPGARQPGPGAKWVTWGEALALGVNRQTLSRWARAGLVRFVGGRVDRKYLLRDLVIRIARKHRNVVGNHGNVIKE